MAAAWINTKQPSCEIARIRTRAILLTTGTFNLVCQRPTALPPERAPFGPKRILEAPHAKSTQLSAIRWSSKPLHLTRPRNQVSIRCYHRISTSFQPTPAHSTWRFRHLLGKLAAKESTLVASSRFGARSRTSSSACLNTVPAQVGWANRLQPTRKPIVRKRSIGGSCENA